MKLVCWILLIGAGLAARIWNPYHQSCLNLQGDNNSNGGFPNVWACDQHPDQYWEFEATPESGKFRIRQTSYNKCLNLQGDKSFNGGRVNVWTCDNHPDQYWERVTLSGGKYVALRNPHHNKCLNLQSPNNYNGGPPNVWDCDSLHPDQQWEVLAANWGDFTEVRECADFWCKIKCSPDTYGAALYESRIWNSSDWEYDCKNTPTQFKGQYLDGSRSCYKTYFFGAATAMYGRFAIQDSRCQPTYVDGSDKGCSSKGKRKYTYYLKGVAYGFRWETAAYLTYAVVNGRFIAQADGYEYDLFRTGIWGVFYVEDSSCDFAPQWQFISSTCVSGGFKRYTYKITNYPYDRWNHDDCLAFSIVINGFKFSSPTDCGSEKGVAYFDVPDSGCTSQVCPSNIFLIPQSCCTPENESRLVKRGSGGVYPDRTGNQVFMRGVYFIAQLAGTLVVEHVRRVFTVADLRTGSGTNAAVRTYARDLGQSSDDAGHIFACRIGGSGRDPINIFPQTPRINRGAFRVFEGRLAEELERREREGAGVEMTVSLVLVRDNQSSARPTRVFYNAFFTRNGQYISSMSETFENP